MDGNIVNMFILYIWREREVMELIGELVNHSFCYCNQINITSISILNIFKLC
jgi:hypothetical protein